MGRISAKTTTRSKKEKYNVHSFPGRVKNIGGESSSYRSEQKRTHRENSKRDESRRLDSRERTTGEIIRQLIEDARDQEAEKLEQLESIRSRINQLESLLQEIEQE
ncbi:MAG: hypothetical protein QNJ51_25810 [Calothrix sp. MO_167.B12]|nr:hypothetical protein [Calothrix sp. MO_167.B12]